MDKVDQYEEGYDAIVVGSGYGGSVAACRMSLAGIKVCLVEKGRKWESKDFPTDSLKIMSAVRIESQNLGFSFGPKDALFQLYEQDDSVAAMACGLGGGSLVNAGVMLPTPLRARRNPKWPKEWERDWETCEASASAMLRLQSVPTKFSNAKVMEEVVGEEFEETSHGPLKLSVNFDIEDKPNSSLKNQEMGSCLACGNCLAGCPYNAKNSTDKTYLESAVQVGCTIKTECQVQFVVENPDYISTNTKEEKNDRKRRRWLVFLNEIDYLKSDFVILSAGVLGTAHILFQSQMRGLKLSERLGSGFSCNGNTVAYLAGSPAPLNAHGLGNSNFSKIPFQERPGPSISSSYTSSLGFTFQSAVLPTAYPCLLFKGITTYRWPYGSWFFHCVLEKLNHILGLKPHNAMILNAMGYDRSDGEITFVKDTNKICFRPPQDLLLPTKIKAFQKLTKKLGGILFMSKYRSTSVHLLGGCNASSDPSSGVCNSNGQVFDRSHTSSLHPGLYVCDASLIPCSIGINPCLTIATLSEHVSRHLVLDVLKYEGKESNTFGNLKPGSISSLNLERSANLTNRTVVFKETMRGYIGGMPCSAYLKLQINSKFKTRKEMDQMSSVLGISHTLLRGKVGGYVVCRALEVDRLHIIDGEVDLCAVDERTPYTQYIHYRLLLVASSGSRYILEGRKVLNPYLFALYAWRETTTMHVTFNKIVVNNSKEEGVNLKGKLSISMIELLKCLISLKGNARESFVSLILLTFFRTYISQTPRGGHKEFIPLEFHQKSYPKSTLQEIQTEDGFTISCQQWECNQNIWRGEGDKKLNPILLINGYATESYWLPTESNDLVRTLLDGHETWLLQSRLHHLNSSNNFTIEDIARFDIPAVINKMRYLHSPLVKIHVVAHCVGGLAIHMAIMGGHVSAAQIASLSCTNSSMFFELNTSSRFKMWLPLIPMSMVILGKNKTLPLLKTSNDTSRQRLLKFIARLVPRYERCTSDECEVLSGIFGNAFWHGNISPMLHYWLNKQSLPQLPMAAFPHLRKICNTGYIVDADGKNSYLIHPERMTLPTLYLSGGRTLLVTPHTSFLANNYMKLHQPSFRHERVVVEGFGHSDLLIGEESCVKVFPYILTHIRLAEEGKKCMMGGETRNYNKDALAWADDPYVEENGGFWRCVSPSVIIWLVLLLVMAAWVLF